MTKNRSYFFDLSILLIVFILFVYACVIKELPVNGTTIVYFEYTLLKSPPVLITHRIKWEFVPYEVVEIVFNDCCVRVTSKDPNKVDINPISFYAVLKLLKREISEVKEIIHNHPSDQTQLGNPFFSLNDLKFYDQIVKLGFKGSFKLWANGIISDQR